MSKHKYSGTEGVYISFSLPRQTAILRKESFGTTSN
jgi:hypothetical protein